MVHLREVDVKIMEYKRKENERRVKFLGDQAEEKRMEGAENTARVVKEIKKKEQRG